MDRFTLRRKLGGIKRRLLGLPPWNPPAGAPQEIYQYSPDARELWIATPEPPHNFINILYNRNYFTVIDHLARGQGRHLTEDGLVNNVVENERLLYVRDDETGRYFAVNFAPTFREFAAFRCGAGINYLIIENSTDGLCARWRIWVPEGDDPLEIWDVELRDASGRPRRASLFSHVVMKCDGTNLDHGDLYRIARFDESIQGVFIRQDAEAHESLDFAWHNAFMTADPAPAGWNANPGTFIGSRRSLANPLSIEQGRLANMHAAVFTPTVSLHVSLELPAGGAASARFLLGACDEPGMAARLREKHGLSRPRAIEHGGGRPDAGKGCFGEDCFSELIESRKKLHGQVQIQTPNPAINAMLNSWVQTQIHVGATYGRWGWKGYRDTLQQTMGVAAIDPQVARRNIVLACRHQHRDGFAPRGWRPLDDRKFSDSHQWLLQATSEYLKETGDFALLDEAVPYLEGNEATVYEHLMQALRRLNEDRGAHGLCLLFVGDWNDSLSAGKRGRGESVMVSMAFCRCTLLMEALAARLGRPADAQCMRAWHEEMKTAINRHAWDGEWYVTAFDDDGRPVGSRENDEGRIFLVPQAWAQLGKVCDDARWASAWGAVERQLDTGWGLMLNHPAYHSPRPNIGRMTYMRPGHNENASVYTHGSAFAIAALLERGLADRALKAWLDIVPNNPNRPGHCQPNVFYNGFYGPDSEVMPGLADHAWFTGSAPWMFLAVTDQMLGLRRDYDGLRVQPCLPAAWSEARVRRAYRGTTYDVQIKNPQGREAAPAREMTIDGTPHAPGEPLPIDGKSHAVIVNCQ